jgi:hypothetical protein
MFVRYRDFILLIFLFLYGFSFPYGNIDEDASARYEPKKGWILMPGIGTSGGENNYGFNSPYICLEFSFMHSVDKKGYVQVGFGGTYYRCRKYDQYARYQEVVFNNRKEELCGISRIYFYILPRDRLTPYLGIGGGIFYVTAHGRYVRKTKYYTYDDANHKWEYEEKESFHDITTGSILAGITMHFGLKILINPRVDMHLQILQTLSLWELRYPVPIESERWEIRNGLMNKDNSQLSSLDIQYGDEKITVEYPYVVPANDTMIFMTFGFLI